MSVPYVGEDRGVDALLDKGLARIERDVEGKGFEGRARRKTGVGRVGDDDGEEERVVGD